MNTLLGKDIPGNKAVYSQYRPVPKQYSHLMIYTVRTPDYRYIEWRDTKNDHELLHQKLYDIRTSPAEIANVCTREEHQSALKKCQELIGRGFGTISQQCGSFLGDTFVVEFKWVDNTQKPGDILDLYINGDSAPDGRYRYRYNAQVQNTLKR